MRDGWGDEEWTRGGRVPSSSAGNPAPLPTHPSILRSTWQTASWKGQLSGGEVRGLANELWPISDGSLHSANGKETLWPLRGFCLATWNQHLETNVVNWFGGLRKSSIDLIPAWPVPYFLSFSSGVCILCPLFPSPLLYLCGNVLSFFLSLTVQKS